MTGTKSGPKTRSTGKGKSPSAKNMTDSHVNKSAAQAPGKGKNKAANARS